MNLVMAVVWLVFAAVLVIGAWFEIDLGSMNSMKNSPILPMLAMIMALYNFSRWWYLRIQIRHESNPPHVKPRVAKEVEYLPEFDFSKDANDNKPSTGPSTNGHP